MSFGVLEELELIVLDAEDVLEEGEVGPRVIEHGVKVEAPIKHYQ